MKRADDFAERRKHIANLTDQELYDRFWALTEQVVAPLLELGRRNTTPSVERAVLLRMGISSLETQKIVEGCMDHSLMKPRRRPCRLQAVQGEESLHSGAGHLLAQGKYWDEAAALFKEGK